MDHFVFMFYAFALKHVGNCILYAFVWKQDGKIIMAGIYGLLWLECDYNIIMQMVVYIL